MVASEDSTSMLCARVVRGINSRAKYDTPVAARSAASRLAVRAPLEMYWSSVYPASAPADGSRITAMSDFLRASTERGTIATHRSPGKVSFRTPTVLATDMYSVHVEGKDNDSVPIGGVRKSAIQVLGRASQARIAAVTSSGRSRGDMCPHFGISTSSLLGIN